jgi:uncharacterized membrane protein YidH (DUF202 family)
LTAACLGLEENNCVFVSYDQGSTMYHVCSTTLAFLILGTIAIFFGLVRNQNRKQQTEKRKRNKERNINRERERERERKKVKKKMY